MVNAQSKEPIYAFPTPTYEAWPKGAYEVDLYDIDTSTMDFNDGKGSQLRYEFLFVAQADKSDEPKLLKIGTGRNYGSTKASLTKLLDSLIGRPLEKSELPNLDLHSLEGRCAGTITVDKTVSKSGNESNVFLLFQRKDKKTLDIGK